MVTNEDVVSSGRLPLITSPAFVVIKAADTFHTNNDASERDVADRVHLLQDHRLGVDASVPTPGSFTKGRIGFVEWSIVQIGGGARRP